MAMMMRRTSPPKIRTLVVPILLIEPSPNHHETLLAIIAYASQLQPRPRLCVAVPQSWEPFYAKIAEVDEIWPLETFQSVVSLARFARDNQITHVFYNTAYGRWVLKVSWGLRGVHQSGIVHNAEKLLRLSAMGWGIGSRLRHFWVLRERLWEGLPGYWRRKSAPLRLMALPQSVWQALPVLKKPPHECWFAIPGRIEYKRRSYEALITVLRQVRPPTSWRFWLLGPAEAPYSDWPRFQEKIHRYGLEAYFGHFPQGLDFFTYHAYLRACDAVLPLIHPETPYWRTYRRYQITGAFFMAFTHRKPLLLHEAFAEEREFQESALFYRTSGELIRCLERVSDGLPRGFYTSSLWEPAEEVRKLAAGWDWPTEAG